ncbi:MAG: hypothetical protein FJY98_03985 [Candidatus Liptonbacteria bacterium]|nr:hypothetical protein [Candidatus Liptonbacteria bacterium]
MPRYRIPEEPKVEPEQPLRNYQFETRKSMTRRFKIFLGVLVLVLVLLGVWAGSLLSAKKDASGYTAVFLVTGDVYFGKLSWFPWPKLTHAWFLQRSVGQDNQPQLGLAPFTSVFWGPAGDVYLNPKQILFWAPIKSDSQVAKAIDNPSSIQQQTPPQGQVPPQQEQQPSNGTKK